MRVKIVIHYEQKSNKNSFLSHINLIYTIQSYWSRNSFPLIALRNTKSYGLFVRSFWFIMNSTYTSFKCSSAGHNNGTGSDQVKSSLIYIDAMVSDSLHANFNRYISGQLFVVTSWPQRLSWLYQCDFGVGSRHGKLEVGRECCFGGLFQSARSKHFYAQWRGFEHLLQKQM
jgi:hypothetical protein